MEGCKDHHFFWKLQELKKLKITDKYKQDFCG